MTINSAPVISMTDALTEMVQEPTALPPSVRRSRRRGEKCTGLSGGARLCFDIQKSAKQTEYRAYRQDLAASTPLIVPCIMLSIMTYGMNIPYAPKGVFQMFIQTRKTV